MYVVMNTISTSEEKRHETVQAFKRAMPSMKQFQGFLGMEIWTKEDNTLLAVSRWSSKEALDEYTKSSAFGSHHRGGASSEHHSAQQPSAGLTAYYAEILE